MTRKMTFSKKLKAGFGLVIILFIMVMIMFHLAINKTIGHYSYLTKDVLKIELLAEEIKTLMTSCQKDLTAFLFHKKEKHAKNLELHLGLLDEKILHILEANCPVSLELLPTD